ncbi:hypothetical protein OS176_14060, partial [Xanthomonadaceae bacterium XH05]|nr:hypothetical protein [Xanthomonadaceae bacterium XH05]
SRHAFAGPLVDEVSQSQRIDQRVPVHELRDRRDFVQDDLQLVSLFAHDSLDFLSGQRLDVGLLSDGEGVGQNFGSGRHGHFEVISVLLDLRDALDVFAFLNQIIRKT